MPQVDKVTFLPIVFWTLILYVGGFLYLNSTVLFTFLSSLKLAGKRAAKKYATALIGRRLLSNLLLLSMFLKTKLSSHPVKKLKRLTSPRGKLTPDNKSQSCLPSQLVVPLIKPLPALALLARNCNSHRSPSAWFLRLIIIIVVLWLLVRYGECLFTGPLALPWPPLFSRLGVSIRRAVATVRAALTKVFFAVQRCLLPLALRGRDFLAVSWRRLALGLFVFAALVYFSALALAKGPIEEVADFFWAILILSTAGFVYLYLSVTSPGKSGGAAYGLLSLAVVLFGLAWALLWPNYADLCKYAVTLLPPRYQLFDRILEAIPPELKNEYAPFIAVALFFTYVCIALVRNYYR